jgi:hypothetical protein
MVAVEGLAEVVEMLEKIRVALAPVVAVVGEPEVVT